MFKMVAILGLVAGGTGFALYHHTDLFQCSSCKPCATDAVSAAKPSCCSELSPCCQPATSCCEDDSAVTVSKASGCCAMTAGSEAKSVPASVKVVACCEAPCTESLAQHPALGAPAAVLAGIVK